MGSKDDKKKKKNKNVTKIVAGNSLGITHTTTTPQIISKKKFQNGDYKIPRKTKRPLPHTNHPRPFNDENKTTNISTNPRVKTDAKPFAKTHSNNQSVNKKVLSKLCKDVDIRAVRKALESQSKLPEKFKSAFRGKSLELNNAREFTVPKGEQIQHKSRTMLEKNNLKGWLEWLQGRRGWVIDTDKSPYVQYYRDLHEVYDHKVRGIMKEVDGDTKSAIRLLYYNENQQTLWKKASKTQSLHNAVGMIRPFLEVIKFFCTDPWEQWNSLPWLVPALTLDQCKWRIERIRQLVTKLMRNSDWGPDCPVHWAAHPKLNSYPLTIVTPSMMTELVVGVANILTLLFLERKMDIAKDLKDVDDLLASPLWFGGAQDGDHAPAATTKKNSPKGSNSKNPAFLKNSKKKPIRRVPSKCSSVDDVVIDLTALSIND